MLSANDYVEKQEHDVLPFAGCKNKLIGTQVVVELADTEQYTGILKNFTDELVVTLSYAQKMPTLEENEFILCQGTAEKELQLRGVVRVSGIIDEKEQLKVFRTDKEISEMDGSLVVKDPALTPWCADGELLSDDDLLLLPETDEKGMRRACTLLEGGWGAETMFEMNKDKVVGTSTFDESLSQYSNVEIPNCDDEQLKRAYQIAKSVECSAESKRNAMLENDDEERNLSEKTDYKLERNRSTEKFQQPSQQQRPPRMVREGAGPRRVSGSISMTSGKRWVDRGQHTNERNAEQSTTNWRNPNPQPPQHHQRGHYVVKAQRSSSGYNQQQSRPYQQQQYHQTPYKNTVGRTSNYEVNTSQNMNTGRNRSDMANEQRMITASTIAKPLAESVMSNNSFPSQHFQQHREEQNTPQQIPPDPEIVGKVKSEQGQEGTTEEKEAKLPVIVQKTKEMKREGTSETGEQKEKSKLNPDAAPFFPKSKDLNTVSAVATTNTSPLMSNPIHPFVQLSTALPTQGISSQNLVFYHQQPQAVVPAQNITNASSYHQQQQTIVPAQVPPNSVSYHQQQQQTVLPTQIQSSQIFYQQQQQNVVSAQLPANPLYATYPIGNTGQSFVFVSPNTPNQALILQPGVAQHFIPVSAATFQSQNVSQHYRTVTPNGINPQATMPHHPTNICPPPLHPATQGMVIQSPPALLNLTMPPNCVASAPPPPPFHPTGRYQQQF